MEKKLYLQYTDGIKQPCAITEPFLSFIMRYYKYGSVIVCGCFIFTIRWKYRFFIMFFPWREPRLRHFSGYPFGTSRKKASTIFYNTAINIMSIPIYRDVYRIFFWRWIPFLNLRRNGALSWLTGSVEFLFSVLKNKILSICYGCSCFIFLIWWEYSFYLLSRHWGLIWILLAIHLEF